MKTCPDCGTQYEDHVGTCLVDGTDLSTVAAAAPPAAPPAGPPSHPPQALTAPGPAPVARGGSIAAMAIVGAGLLFFLLAAMAILLVFVWPSSSTTEVAPDPVPTPTPVAVPVAVPVTVPLPDPAPADGPLIQIDSVPTGAEIWEGSTKLCVTPCKTPHPEHAPLPRAFVLKREGYLDTPFDMNDPAATHSVPMRRARPVAAPAPGPRLPKIDTER